MDPSKGTFTVEEAGVYQFTFTGFVTSRVSLWLVNLFLTLIGQYIIRPGTWSVLTSTIGVEGRTASLAEAQPRQWRTGFWARTMTCTRPSASCCRRGSAPGTRSWCPWSYTAITAAPNWTRTGHGRSYLLGWKYQTDHSYYICYVESSNLANKLWYLDVVYTLKYIYSSTMLLSSQWELWRGGQYWPRNVTLHILSCQIVTQTCLPPLCLLFEQLSDYNLDCYWPDFLTTISCSFNVWKYS